MTGTTEEKAVPAADEQKLEISANTGYINYLDGASLNKAYKNAMILSKSELVPDTYRNKPENVLIAMDIASRSGFGLMTIMQSLYIVHGRPAFGGSFCVAAINGCGKFSPLSFVFVGDEGSSEYGCYAIATRASDGVVCKSTTVTLQMAKDEGWMRNSKWKTMPEQMMKYRSASFFARSYCPEILMGMQTVDEVNDVRGEEGRREKTTIRLEGIEVIEQEA